MREKFPALFRPARWFGTTDVCFERRTSPPDASLISNVNIVPYVGDAWLILRMSAGCWDVPGGTLEPGESYLDCLRRELLEEAGARLVDYVPLGAWRCYSHTPEPYHPHISHPVFYRFVVTGAVEIVGRPSNPEDGEHVVAVETVVLSEAVRRFRADGRDDLAELYQMAALLRDERTS